MTETPPDDVDSNPEDPVEPRLSPDSDTDVESAGDGDETLVSEGDPPSTSNN